MSWLPGPPWGPAAIAFVVGACLGPFLNRCIDRFQRHELLGDQLRSLFRSSPAERSLRRARKLRHRLPVLGWLMPRHPLDRGRRENVRRAAVELMNGLLFAALVWVEFPNGFTQGAPDPFAVPGLPFFSAAHGSLALQLIRLASHLVLIQALIVASAIDLDRMIIPDGSTVPAAVFALIVSAASGGLSLVPIWFEDAGLTAILGFGGEPGGGYEVPAWVTLHPHLHGLLASSVGLLVGGGVVWSVRLIGHWALGREAMGFGDVIFLAMIGSFLGWQPILVVFFLAPVCAIVVVLFAAITGTSREFPYGPWLSLATLLLLLGWQFIWPYAGRFFLMGRLIPFVAVSVLILLAVLLRGMRLIRGDDRWYEEAGVTWSSADQLIYQSRERPEPAHGSWRARRAGEWPGLVSGRGTLAIRRWRSPPAPARRWRVRPRP